MTTNKKKTTTSTSRGSDDADGCGAGTDYAIREEDGAQIVATKEPVLLVINDPGPASNADHGGRGNFESNRSGDSGSDGEDDEVCNLLKHVSHRGLYDTTVTTVLSRLLLLLFGEGKKRRREKKRKEKVS